MAYSKVTLNNQTIMDVTTDTVTAETLLTGSVATGKDGQKIQGAYEGGGSTVPACKVTITSGNAGFRTYHRIIAAQSASGKLTVITPETEGRNVVVYARIASGDDTYPAQFMVYSSAPQTHGHSTSALNGCSVVTNTTPYILINAQDNATLSLYDSDLS